MKVDSKIYVSGHHGMVGHAMVSLLKRNGYNNLLFLRSSELDLRRQDEVEVFFRVNKPEYVFLFAAKVGGIGANIKYPVEFLYDNLMIEANVIKSAFMYNVRKLIFLGSSCIYPRYANQPMKEDYLLTGTLEPTNEGYALAKIVGIKLCKYFNEEYKTNFISVMPPNLYGPNDNFNLQSSHVLAALIRKFHLAKLLKNNMKEKIIRDINYWDKEAGINDFEDAISYLEEYGITKDYVMIWGTGNVYREFLHVDDLTSALLFAMNNLDYKDIGEFVNIGSGKDITIRELAYLIRDIVEFEGDIRFDKTKPDGMPRKLLDISRIKGLGWEPKIGLREGISDTYKWYRENMGD